MFLSHFLRASLTFFFIRITLLSFPAPESFAASSSNVRIPRFPSRICPAAAKGQFCGFTVHQRRPPLCHDIKPTKKYMMHKPIPNESKYIMKYFGRAVFFFLNMLTGAFEIHDRLSFRAKRERERDVSPYQYKRQWHSSNSFPPSLNSTYFISSTCFPVMVPAYSCCSQVKLRL